MKRSEERVKVLGEIIQNVTVRSLSLFRDKDFDEISQELWVAVLVAEEKAQRDLDVPLLYDICYKQIRMMQRYAMKRNVISVEIDLDYPESDSDFNLNESLEKVDIHDLLNQYPKDTPERTYLEYYCTATNIEDFNYETRSRYKGGFTEDELAHLLGFNSCSNSGYRSLRKAMREVVSKYFNYIPKEDTTKSG